MVGRAVPSAPPLPLAIPLAGDGAPCHCAPNTVHHAEIEATNGPDVDGQPDFIRSPASSAFSLSTSSVPSLNSLAQVQPACYKQPMNSAHSTLLAITFIAAFAVPAHPADFQLNPQANQWRAEHRTIDLHQHIDYTTQHLARAVKIMDAVGLGIGVNLSGGTVTRGTNGAESEFEHNKKLAEMLYPGRFLHYMNLDYKGWDEPDFAERAAKQIEEGHRLGAAGFKEFKRLGLYLRDGKGQLIKIDDPKLDPMWERCGELNMPVSIH